MYAQSSIEEYVRPGAELDELKKGCYKSEFQYLDRKPIEVSVSPEGGTIFPDFLLYRDYVPLISERFRQFMDNFGVDNLFYKPVILSDKELGLREMYWLALPPRIVCLNLAKSIIEVENNEYEKDDNKFREAIKIVINPKCVGNYKIFKLAMKYENQEIIVCDALRRAIEEKNFSNVYFEELP